MLSTDVLDVVPEDQLKNDFRIAQNYAASFGGKINYIQGSVTDRAVCQEACSLISQEEGRFE